MAGILKVDQYQDFNGNNIITSDGSGNVTVNANGMKNVPAFKAYATSGQSVASGSHTKLNYTTEVFDTDGMYDASNSRWQPTTAGYYFVTGGARFDPDSETELWLQLRKNGSHYLSLFDFQPTDSWCNMGSRIMYANGSDYFELYAYHGSGSTETFGSGDEHTEFSAYKIIGA
jgi:hypothetical protein